MARNRTLAELRDMLRAEIGASSNVAMGINTSNQHDHILRRTQERLWIDFDWWFGRIQRTEQLNAGQRYYAYDNDVDPDRILETTVKYAEHWHIVEYGISTEDRNIYDADEGQGNDFVLRWEHYENDMYEVWPVPTSPQVLKFECIRKLPPLISSDDRALLDDNLIVLFAAAEILARGKAEDAQIKLAQANSLYARIKGAGNKTQSFVFGGPLHRGERLRIVGGKFVREK